MGNVVKVLSIDGGGLRGVIPAMLLNEIEERTGSRIADLFDLIAGTSTGGIVALGLVKPSRDDPGRPEYEARELCDLYESEGGRIFRDAGTNGRYDATALEAALGQYLGDAPLSAAVTETLVTSYELETRRPWFFTRHRARSDPAFDFPMALVARATSAVPTFLEPAELPAAGGTRSLVDGGVFANNPAMCAYVEMKKLRPESDVLLVSLGTGRRRRPIHHADARRWGEAEWARPILSVVFDGVRDTVDHQLSVLCRESDGDPRYYRIQTELDSGTGEIDADVDVLRRRAWQTIEERSDDLDALCGRLTRPVAGRT